MTKWNLGMDLKVRVLLAVSAGLCTYFALLAGTQINLAGEALSILKSCESGHVKNCINPQEYSRLVNRWDGNIKVYFVLCSLFSLGCGYFSPKKKK